MEIGKVRLIEIIMLADPLVFEELINNYGWFSANRHDFKGVENILTFVAILLPKWSPKDISLIESQGDYINDFGHDVYVFDIDNFETQAQIEETLIGFPKVSQTPIVGVYEDGILKSFVCGMEEK